MIEPETNETYRRQMAAVHEITQALHGAADSTEMKALTLDAALSLLKAEAGSLLLHDAARDVLVFDVVRGSAAPALTGAALNAAGASIIAEVFRDGRPILSNDPDRNPSHDRTIDAATHFTTRSLLTAPLRQRGGLSFGVVQIVNKCVGEFDSGDADALDVIGNVLAMALENARLAQEAQLAAVARSLGELSHDIGNMLSGILPYVQTLGAFVEAAGGGEQESLSELAGFYAETLAATTDSVQRIRALASDVAGAVKGETAPLALATGDPAAVARDVIRALGEASRARGVSLRVECGEALAGQVTLDARRLYNALYNLVNNALAETASGGSVAILFDDAPPEGDLWYAASVCDTGRGMPESVRARLFTDAAVSTKPGGTGLGTRIVRRIAEQHGGTVTVESVEGTGTTVRLLLPKSPVVAS